MDLEGFKETFRDFKGFESISWIFFGFLGILRDFKVF